MLFWILSRGGEAHPVKKETLIDATLCRDFDTFSDPFLNITAVGTEESELRQAFETRDGFAAQVDGLPFSGERNIRVGGEQGMPAIKCRVVARSFFSDRIFELRWKMPTEDDVVDRQEFKRLP
jgi:hypothetical protein